MSPPDRALAYRLFSAALELNPDLREEFLARECRGDPELRAEIDALLEVASHDTAITSAFLSVVPRQEEDLVGRIYGRFRLLERVGQGGMGVVYRAERTDGVPQSVAIKVIATTVAPPGQARFEREAQLLARLEHPAVARLIDAGVDNGRAWIAMEFVKGRRIDEWCSERHLPARDIVGLLVQLADAVAAAHRMLVVHNDIKPTNVLVTADGVPKLIDFGISTALQDSTPGCAATLSAGRLFSPGFAAPEQIGGGPVTVATDVYGLGALSYRLLTGGPTFPDAIEPVPYMLAISRRDVDLPSRAALKAGRSPLEARLLRGDLDAILCKALERDPARRYASAADMQSDLNRYLLRRPVRARAATVFYRLGKFVRRNTLEVGLGALLLVGTIVGGIVLEQQRHRAALARDMAARRGEFLENVLKSADPSHGRRDITVAELLDSATEGLDRKLGSEPLVEASMLGLIAQTNTGLGRYPQGLAANERQLNILRTGGGSALEIGQALSARGELLREQGKWIEAEPPLRDAVALLRSERSPTDLCDALDALGVVLGHTENEKAAEATLREEIAIESRGDSELRKRRMNPYFALTVILGDQGRYAEAAQYGRDAWVLARDSLPRDHPDLLNIETAYASSLVSIHRGAEAERLFREVLAVQTRVLGSEHKATLLTQLTLADDLLDLHRDAEAAATALPAARQLESLLGKDNLYALGAWWVYGTSACNSHQEDAGLTALRGVEAARRRIYPPGNWFIYSTQLSIGLCLYQAHQYVDAEPTLLAAATGLETARGPSYNRTQDAYRSLRDLYVAMSRPEEAVRWEKKILP